MAARQFMDEVQLRKKFNLLSQNYFMLLGFVLVFVRIFWLMLLGDSGMGYLALPMDLYLIGLVGLAIPISKTVSGLMKLYLKRGQIKNANLLGQTGVLLSCILGAVLGLVLCVFNKQLDGFMGARYTWIGILFASAALFLLLVASGAKGFLLGVNADFFVIIGNGLELVLFLVLSFVGAYLGHNEGLQAMVLLRNTELEFVYSATGLMVGITLAQLVASIYWLVLYFISMHALKLGEKNDQTKRLEPTKLLLRRVVNNMLPSFLGGMLSQLMLLLAQWNYLHHLTSEVPLEKAIAFWGCFYGKYLPYMVLPIYICLYYLDNAQKKITIAYEKDESRMLRDRLEKGLIKLNAIAFTGSIFTAILGQAYLEGVCDGMITSMQTVIQTTSTLILAYCYYQFSHTLMQRMQYHGESMMIQGIAAFVSVLFSLVLFRGAASNLQLAAITLILFYGIAGILGMLRVIKKLRCPTNWMKAFAYPLICSCIGGLVVLLLARCFYGLIGPLLTLLIGLLIGILLQVLSLLAFHIVQENQVERMPFGKIICSIAHVFGIV